MLTKHVLPRLQPALEARQVVLPGHGAEGVLCPGAGAAAVCGSGPSTEPSLCVHVCACVRVWGRGGGVGGTLFRGRPCGAQRSPPLRFSVELAQPGLGSSWRGALVPPLGEQHTAGFATRPSRPERCGQMADHTRRHYRAGGGGNSEPTVERTARKERKSRRPRTHTDPPGRRSRRVRASY